MIEFLSPHRVVFGRGAIAAAGAEAARLGSKALLVTGLGARRRPATLDALIASLDRAGVAHVLFDAVEPDPSLATVEAGAALYRESGCGLLVGLGAFGVGEGDLPGLAADAFTAPSTAMNPRAPTEADIVALYRARL